MHSVTIYRRYAYQSPNHRPLWSFILTILTIPHVNKHEVVKIHIPRAHGVKNQRVIAKRTSQIMKYGQDVIIQKRTYDNIQFGKWY